MCLYKIDNWNRTQTCNAAAESRSSLTKSVFLMMMCGGERSVLMVCSTWSLRLYRRKPVTTPSRARRSREPPAEGRVQKFLLNR